MPVRFSLTRSLLALAIAAIACPAHAQTYTWTGGGQSTGNTFWNAPANWGGTLPVSSIDTTIAYVSSSVNFTSNQNIANPFVLNSLTFGQFVAPFSIVGSNGLDFRTSSAGVTPTIVLTDGQNINVPVTFTNDTAITSPGPGVQGSVMFNSTVGGPGALTVGSTTSTTKATTVIMNGVVGLTATITINRGNLFLSGADGAATGVSSFAVNQNGILTLSDNSGSNSNRIANTATVTLNGGTLRLTPAETMAGSSETVGTIAFGTGLSTVEALRGSNPSTTGPSVIIATNAPTRTAGSIVDYLGFNLGAALNATPIGGVSRIQYGISPTMIGGGGADGTTTISILPQAVGKDFSVGSHDFVTHGTNGIRVLTSAEYSTGLPDGVTSDDNVRVSSTVGGLNSATTAVNALKVSGNAKVNGTGTLTIRSGAILVGDSGSGTPQINVSTLAFGGREAMFMGQLNTSVLVQSVITGTGGLTSNVSLVLGGGLNPNTYTGTSTFLGTTQLNKNPGVNAVGGDVVVAGYAVLRINEGHDEQIPNTASLTINGGTLQMSNSIETVGTFSLANGQVLLNGATLKTTSASGQLVIGKDGEINGYGTTGNVLLQSNAKITVTNGNLATGAIANSAANAGTIAIDASRTLTVNTDTNATFDGLVSGAGGMTKSGTGTFTLGGGTSSANTFTGLTTVTAGMLQLGTATGVAAVGGSVTVSGGTLKLTNGNEVIPNAAALTVNGGTFDVNGKTETAGTFSGTGGTVALNGGSFTVTQATNQSFAGSLTGSGTFAKAGSGSLALTGTLSGFTGHYNVTAGTLTIAAGVTLGAGRIVNGSGALSVGIGASGLSVSSGGRIAPGNNSVGTLTVGGDATFASGAVLEVEFAAASADQLSHTAAGNTLTFSSGFVLNLKRLGTPADTTNYTIVTSTGTLTTPSFTGASFTVDNVGHPTGSYTGGNVSFQIVPGEYSGGETISLSRSGNDLVLSFTPVPEPRMGVALLIGGAVVAGWNRRRRGQVKAASASGVEEQRGRS